MKFPLDNFHEKESWNAFGETIPNNYCLKTGRKIRTRTYSETSTHNQMSHFLTRSWLIWPLKQTGSTQS